MQRRSLHSVLLITSCFALPLRFATAQAVAHDVTLPIGEYSDYSSAGVGDIDHDGVDDFAVCCASWLNSYGGRVEIRSGRTAAILTVLVSPTASNAFGGSIARIHDVDGDGLDELAIADLADGSVRLVAPATGTIHWMRTGLARHFATVESAGDVDMDGVDDVVLANPHELLSAGFTQDYSVLSGATGSTLQSAVLGHGQLLHMGACGVGDIDGDGHGDVLIGDPLLGSVQIFSGATGAVIRTHSSSVPANADFGRSAAELSDLDGDGVSEYAIGMQSATPATAGLGAIRVYSGASGTELYTIVGTLDEVIGVRMSAAGDVDLDGKIDLQTSAQHSNTTTNSVLVYSGATGALIARYSGRAAGNSMIPNQFGWALAVVGDLNHDGRADSIAVGVEGPLAALAHPFFRVFLGGVVEPQVYGTTVPNSQGCSPEITFSGVPSLSIGDPITLHAENVLNHKRGMLIWSTQPAQQPLFTGGVLWIGPGIRRTPIQDSNGSALPAVDCSGTYSFTFNAPYAASAGIAPGTHICAQFLMRDPFASLPVGVVGTSTTNAIAFDLVP